MLGCAWEEFFGEGECRQRSSEVGEPPGASRARDISGHRLALFLFCLIFSFSKDLCLLQVDGNAVSEEGGTLGTHYPFI